jgi:catechol 2,3-dioxygenase-like lactoylglutathione lyase family enzyme
MNLFDTNVRPHHYGIFVTDHDASVQWYQEKLEFKLKSTAEQDGVKISFLEAGNFILEIVENTNEPTWRHKSGEHSQAHFAFHTENLDAKADEACSRGLKFFIPLTTNTAINARYFHVLDPDGHIIEFIETK